FMQRRNPPSTPLAPITTLYRATPARNLIVMARIVIAPRFSGRSSVNVSWASTAGPETRLRDSCRSMKAPIVIACVLLASVLANHATPTIQVHPDNPHYFLWRGQAAALITAGEHYGAVMNLDFDYAVTSAPAAPVRAATANEIPVVDPFLMLSGALLKDSFDGPQ